MVRNMIGWRAIIFKYKGRHSFDELHRHLLSPPIFRSNLTFCDSLDKRVNKIHSRRNNLFLKCLTSLKSRPTNEWLIMEPAIDFRGKIRTICGLKTKRHPSLGAFWIQNPPKISQNLYKKQNFWENLVLSEVLRRQNYLWRPRRETNSRSVPVWVVLDELIWCGH